jgi:hypothetical protein
MFVIVIIIVVALRVEELSYKLIGRGFAIR